jgi:hypothetical protein
LKGNGYLKHSCHNPSLIFSTPIVEGVTRPSLVRKEFIMKYLVTLTKNVWTFDEDGEEICIPDGESYAMLEHEDIEMAKAFAEDLADIYANSLLGEITHVQQNGQYGIIDHFTIEGGEVKYIITVEELPD